MTAARLQANRNNALRSTGPLTPAGKAKNAVNAIKGGLFAKSLVVPTLGESAEEYEEFCQLVVSDLAPEGIVEQELAERVVVLLWRLRRVVRYEAAAITSTPARLPRHPDEVHRLEVDASFGLPPNAPIDRRLALVRDRLHHAGFKLDSHRKAVVMARDLAKWPAAEVLHWQVVELIVSAASEQLGWEEEVPGERDPWSKVATEFGFENPRMRRVDRPAGQLRDLIRAAAKSGGYEPEPFLKALAQRVAAGLGETENKVSRLEAEERELADRMLREREAAAGAPAFAERGVIEQVMRAEAHLSRELDRTLTMLDRLQGRRAEPRGRTWAAGVLVGLPNGVGGDGNRNGFDLQKRPRLSIGDSDGGDDAATEAVPVRAVANGG